MRLAARVFRVVSIATSVSIATAVGAGVVPSANAASVPPAAVFTNWATDATYFYDGVGGDPNRVSTGDNGADEDAAISPDGATTYVLHTPGYNLAGQLDLLAVDTATRAIRGTVASVQTSVETGSRLALSADGATAYVASGGVITPISVATGGVLPAITLGGVIHAVAASPDGRTLYASVDNRVVKINLRTGRVVSSLDLGQPAGAIKLTADGATAYVIGDIVAGYSGPLYQSGARLFRLDTARFVTTSQLDLPASAIYGSGNTTLGLAISPKQYLLYFLFC
jgi:hypothetical protein